MILPEIPKFIPIEIYTPPTNMRNICRVVIEEGHQFVVMPSGERIPKQIWTRVFDGPNPEEAYAIIKVKVDLSDDRFNTKDSAQ